MPDVWKQSDCIEKVYLQELSTLNKLVLLVITAYFGKLQDVKIADQQVVVVH